MNSDENGDEDLESAGDMSEHMQRYKNYIDNLKQGKSSGISSVFGRASDLLPSEVMEIKQPAVHAHGFPSEPKTLPADRAEQAEDMDEDEGFTDETEIEVEDDDDDSDRETDDHDSDDRDEDFDEDELEDEEDQDFDEDDEDNCDEYEVDDHDIEAGDDHITVTNELAVTARNGAPLWNIFFNRAEPVLITMNDGSSIRTAEGRDQSVLALKTTGSRFKFFILSGLVIDPSTGNIYAEANDGAYTVAFLNSGWQIHQYRTHSGAEVYYATEPFRKGRDRVTMQIMNLRLDPATGDVSYDSADGSASMTLKSRRL